jgi:predicted transcriptional regulator
MPSPEVPAEIAERIRTAPAGTTDTTLARELGIHRNTVRKYRKVGRQEREEIAREVLARHVEENIPDALADLTEIRRLAREVYERTQDPRQGNLWLSAVKTTLEHVSPDAAALDAAIDAELAALHEEGQGGVSRPGAGAPAGSAAAVN